MAILLNIKDYVATQTGQSNGSSVDVDRDNLINAARRTFYSRFQWSFLTKTATVSISSQLGTFPTDLNKKFDPIKVYYYTGTTKYEFVRVEMSQVDSYDTNDWVYAVDKVNGRIKINRTDVTSVSMEYTFLPTDWRVTTEDNASTEQAPDIMAIAYLATAMYWLSGERSMTKYQLFNDLYEKEIIDMIAYDQQNGSPYQQFNIGRQNLGYNNPSFRRDLNTGYKK